MRLCLLVALEAKAVSSQERDVPNINGMATDPQTIVEGPQNLQQLTYSN